MSSETPEQQNMSADTTEDSETLSPLEQEVLDEYARLLENLNNMSTLLATLSTSPSAEILDALRGLERKTSLVFTLLKASVYSIVLNQQIQDGPGSEVGDAGGGDGGGGDGGGMTNMGMGGLTGMTGFGGGTGIGSGGMGGMGGGGQDLGSSRGSVL